MFSPRDLIFVLCSRDLDVLRAQRSMGFYYPQINEVGKSDHMGNNRLGCNLAISKADTEAVFNHRVLHTNTATTLYVMIFISHHPLGAKFFLGRVLRKGNVFTMHPKKRILAGDGACVCFGKMYSRASNICHTNNDHVLITTSSFNQKRTAKRKQQSDWKNDSVCDT